MNQWSDSYQRRLDTCQGETAAGRRGSVPRVISFRKCKDELACLVLSCGANGLALREHF